jgi:hypothetical protein
MKYIILISLFLTSTIFAQTQKNIVEETFDRLKENTKVDKTDLTCYMLSQKMYDEVLQNDKSDFKKSTIEEIKNFQTLF